MTFALAVPMLPFELVCAVVIALTIFSMARSRPWNALAIEYALLAISAYVGEETCIALYHFYAYAPEWFLRLHHVPVLIPLIWPLVIVSARDVAASLFPIRGRTRVLAVFVLVVLDASLVEIVAVHAGLWSWSEPGYFHVPIIGILGWGFFGAASELVLSQDRKWHPATLVLAPLLTHALLLLTWWLCFRWVLRAELPQESVLSLIVAVAVGVFAVLQARRRGARVPMSVAVPRIVATSVFVGLLLLTRGVTWPYWFHFACLALVYSSASLPITKPSARAGVTR